MEEEEVEDQDGASSLYATESEYETTETETDEEDGNKSQR